MLPASNQKKESHVLLGDFNDSFTNRILSLALQSLKDPTIRKPSFMRAVPGHWSKTKQGSLRYTDESGRSWLIVPFEHREKFLWLLWKQPTSPRGQMSFYNFLRRRYLGIPQRMVYEFVSAQVPIQMVTALKNPTKGTRSIQPKTPFSHLSMDLGDHISFEDKYNRNFDRWRFVLLLCDNYSGYVFARRLKTKSGPEVAKALTGILGEIKKFGGTPSRITHDLGKEFYNQHVSGLLNDRKIKQAKPFKATVAAFIENRIRTFKRYNRLLSELMFKGNAWYEKHIIRNTCKAMNNIQRKDGFSPLDIVTAFRKNDQMKLSEIYSNQTRYDRDKDLKSKFEKNDRVRIRVAKNPGKLDLKHKSHLGFDPVTAKPINWSTEIYTILDVRHYTRLKKFKYLLSNRRWYNAYELIKLPRRIFDRKFERIVPNRRHHNRARNIPPRPKKL